MPAKFSVGDVLGTSFKLFARKAHVFLPLTAIAYLPLIAWGASLASGAGITNRQLEHYETGLSYLRLALDAFSASAIAFGVRAALSGERAGFLACLGAGVRRGLPSLVILIVASIATLLGAFLLVVPGLMILCVTYVAVPAAVIERSGPFASLERSRALTLGHRLKIFGMLLVVWVAMFVLLVVVAIIANPENYWARTTFVWLFAGFEVVIGTLSAIISAVTYVRLRAVEEGGDAGLGKVFE